MEVVTIHEFEEKIERWDGKISVDTYHLEGDTSVLVLTLHDSDHILGLTYRGNHRDVVFAIHSLATKYNHKILNMQKEDIKKIDETTSHQVL